MNEEDVEVNASSLERWCDEVGGDFYEEMPMKNRGHVGCEFADSHKLEIGRRAGRPNKFQLKAPGLQRDYGYAKDSDLVRHGDKSYSFKTTEGTFHLDMRSGEISESAPTASKSELARKRDEEATTY